MCSSKVVTYVTDGKIDRVIFMLTNGSRNSRFITAKYNRDEHGPMCPGIRSNNVL